MRRLDIRQLLVEFIIIALCLSSTAFAENQTTGEVKEAPIVAEPLPNPENAAIVNGKVISYDDFAVELDMQRRRIQQQGQTIPDQMLPLLRARVLESLINLELLYQESVKRNIKVSNEDIDKEVTEIKGRFKDPNQFESALAGMKMSEADLRKQIAQRSAIQHLLDAEVITGGEVSETEAQAFYSDNPGYFQQPEQIRARHILIKVDEKASDAEKTVARKKIEAIQKRIVQGEDFGELAKKESEGPSSTRGGDLDYFSRGSMVKPFEEAAFALKPDEVSDIVETPYGYHLIQLMDRKPAQIIPFIEVKDQIIMKLSDDLKKKKTQAYVESLRQEAKIERFVNNAN
jgi:peptidyl-prolyl cis-trans isomerase C